MAGSTDTFLWTNAAGGAWTVPGNWADQTSGATPSPIAPDASSTADIAGPTTGNPLTIGGPGAVATLTASGLVTLSGVFTFGSASIAGSGEVLTIQGLDPVTGTLSATANALMMLPNAVTLNGGSLVAGNPYSTIQIGGTPGAFDGVVIADGATLSGSGVVSSGYDFSSDLNSDTVSLSVDGYVQVYGLLQAQSITVLGTLTGTGTVDVLPDGVFSSTVAIDPGSELLFRIENNATAELSPVFSQANTIDFTGGQGVVWFEYDLDEPFPAIPPIPSSQIDVSAPIVDFAEGDRLFGLLDRVGGVDAANFAQTGNTGTLTVSAGDGSGTNAVSLVLQGTYSTPDFLLTVTPDNITVGGASFAFQIDSPQREGFSDSGSGTGDNFNYVGPSGGAWGDAANWFDTTAGQAAVAAPGTDDDATIVGSTGPLFTVLTQVGNARTLSVTGNVAAEGQIAASTLLLNASSDYLLVTNGGTVTATALDIAASGAEVEAYGNYPTGAAGFVDITGGATISPGGLLWAFSGGRVQLGSLTIDGGNAGNLNSVEIDSVATLVSNGDKVATQNDSGITIGTLNDAASGELRVDPGATLTDLTSPSSIQSRIGAPVTDNGTIVASNLWVQYLSGAGEVIVSPNGTMSDADGFLDPASSISFQIGSGAYLGIDGNAVGAVPVNVGFTLTGTNDSLYFGIGVSVSNLFIPAAISGFGDGDSIGVGLDLYPTAFVDPIFSASFTSTGSGGDDLALLDVSGNQVGGLNLLGDYAGDSFVVTQGWNIVEAEPGTFGLSAGTKGDSFTYTGISGGAWGDAANWTDTSNAGVQVAPGANDTVTFAGGGSNGLTVLTGTGDASDLISTQFIAVAGIVNAGTVTFGAQATDSAYDPASLDIDAGGTVDTGSLLLTNSTATVVFSFPAVAVDGPGAMMNIGGVSSPVLILGEFPPNGFSAANGGSLSIGSWSVNYLNLLGAGNIPLSASNDATLILPVTLPSTVSISLSGTGDTLGFVSPAAATLSVAAPIAGFADTDIVDVTFAGSVSSVAFTQNGTTSETAAFKDAANHSLGSLTFSGDFTSHTFYSDPVSANTTQIVLDVNCFRAGTRIATPNGPVAVEALTDGDWVVTISGKAARVLWTGRRAVDCRAHARPKSVWPVCISAEAFGPGRPVRDLFLSPDHAVFVREVLVPVRYLINGTSIRVVPMDEVTYCHIELMSHDILLAEALPCESYLDAGDRGNFAASETATRSFRHFAAHARAEQWEAGGYARLVVTGPELRALQCEINDRAAGLFSERRLLGADMAI